VSELHFGECEGLCGSQVTFPGWDRYCDSCEQEMREEQDERNQRLSEEDHLLYSIPGDDGDGR
jgi:hypothetical protein